jgi:hypothetical protein
VPFKIQFLSIDNAPKPDELAGWLTEEGEPFELEPPFGLVLRALPLRLVQSESQGLTAYLDVRPNLSLTRVIQLLFNLSLRMGTDVELAGQGTVTRASLWMRLADEQDRQRIAAALAKAEDHGKLDEVGRSLWAVLGSLIPQTDIRWDSSRRMIVELAEAGVNIPLAEARQHSPDVQHGDVVALTPRASSTLHILAWRWLSEAHPSLAGEFS